MLLLISASSFRVELSLSSTTTLESMTETIMVSVRLSRKDNMTFTLDHVVMVGLSVSGQTGIAGECVPSCFFPMLYRMELEYVVIDV